MRDTRSVLLVEDDEIDREATKRAFKKLKIVNPLETVANGEEALAYLRNQANARPCLILLDLNMPRMNGFELLQAIKQDANLRRIPVVVFTTSREEEDKVDSYNYGVAGYIVKPPEADKFTDIFRTLDMYWTLSEMPT